ncbi:hypothetical protein MPTK1_2g22290 [Marchantia polymorpha subsp. ruderalis]|uniref:Uncharacterized protein n=1 Tax=Marchantia polymorpha TaxID=3197 RepID=A0A2R6WNC8_MARPO|nr:hypothetical protein MARPO_0072s0098 [Marchantia polymorpha]BBN03283.1 hypothetical protein Mp_2g22290 [Marchantia polymorpha subsp. ruderalis]|eukprot:PTQ35365.1 hypothetical protein MARPO_0072s0098 [Marchantia polymorpha]
MLSVGAALCCAKVATTSMKVCRALVRHTSTRSIYKFPICVFLKDHSSRTKNLPTDQCTCDKWLQRRLKVQSSRPRADEDAGGLENCSSGHFLSSEECHRGYTVSLARSGHEVQEDLIHNVIFVFC